MKSEQVENIMKADCTTYEQLLITQSVDISHYDGHCMIRGKARL